MGVMSFKASPCSKSTYLRSSYGGGGGSGGRENKEKKQPIFLTFGMNNVQ